MDVHLALHHLVVLWAPPWSSLLAAVVVVAIGPLVWIRTWAVSVHVRRHTCLRTSCNAWLPKVWHAEMSPALHMWLGECHGAWSRRPVATGGRVVFHNMCLNTLWWTRCGALGAALRGLPHSAQLDTFGSTGCTWHVLHCTGVLVWREDWCGALHSTWNIAMLLVLVPITSHCPGVERDLKSKVGETGKSIPCRSLLVSDKWPFCCLSLLLWLSAIISVAEAAFTISIKASDVVWNRQLLSWGEGVFRAWLQNDLCVSTSEAVACRGLELRFSSFVTRAIIYLLSTHFSWKQNCFLLAPGKAKESIGCLYANLNCRTEDCYLCNWCGDVAELYFKKPYVH